LIREDGRIVRLDEVEVEVPRRLGGRSLVRGAEEEIATPSRSAFSPLDFVLPDVVARDVLRRCRVLEDDLLERVEVVLVELRIRQTFRLQINQRLEIDVLLEVDEVLAVVAVEGQELA